MTVPNIGRETTIVVINTYMDARCDSDCPICHGQDSRGMCDSRLYAGEPNRSNWGPLRLW